MKRYFLCFVIGILIMYGCTSQQEANDPFSITQFYHEENGEISYQMTGIPWNTSQEQIVEMLDLKNARMEGSSYVVEQDMIYGTKKYDGKIVYQFSGDILAVTYNYRAATEEEYNELVDMIEKDFDSLKSAEELSHGSLKEGLMSYKIGGDGSMIAVQGVPSGWAVTIILSETAPIL